jgi:hypothetical protein
MAIFGGCAIHWACFLCAPWLQQPEGVADDHTIAFKMRPLSATRIREVITDILQYRLRFGSSLLYKSVFHLNSLTAQLSYEGRAAAEWGK